MLRGRMSMVKIVAISATSFICILWIYAFQLSTLISMKEAAGDMKLQPNRADEFLAPANLDGRFQEIHKVNNVADSIRRMYLFRKDPVLEFDYSKDYENKLFDTRRDVDLFTRNLHEKSPEQLITHINKYRSKKRLSGRPMNVYDEKAMRERASALHNWEKWYVNISQYEVYHYDDSVIEKILKDLATTPLVHSKELKDGTQFKLLVTYENDMGGLWKPMRFTRDTETQHAHYYFNDFERHHAEIAGFHLDRVFGFRRTPPVTGRILNITEDIKRYANPKFYKKFFRLPSGDLCFYGECSYYCDSNHPICGHPDWLEGSMAVFLPPEEIAPRFEVKNPWKRSYSRKERAVWEDDDNYCIKVKDSQSIFKTGRNLNDLIDLTIFDFIQGNMDRHHYEMYDFPNTWSNDTTPVVLDNGRGWGKMYKDELSILAPLIQCCQIRHSTLQKIILFDEGPHKLSKLLDVSTSRDPLYPILVSGHLAAADRRVKIILKEVQNCIQKSSWEAVVSDDGF